MFEYVRIMSKVMSRLLFRSCSLCFILIVVNQNFWFDSRECWLFNSSNVSNGRKVSSENFTMCMLTGRFGIRTSDWLRCECRSSAWLRCWCSPGDLSGGPLQETLLETFHGMTIGPHSLVFTRMAQLPRTRSSHNYARKWAWFRPLGRFHSKS